jgi:hypothetical protein
LREYRLFPGRHQDLAAVANGRKESVGVEGADLLGRYRGVLLRVCQQRTSEGTKTYATSMGLYSSAPWSVAK